MASQYADFAAAVLRGIKAPVTPGNVAGFIGWSQAEGPLGSGSWQGFNPLNTTQAAPGARTVNSAGVKRYADAQTGVNATVQTLLNGNYGGIVQAFRSNSPHALGGAIGQSPWGTSGQLASQTISRALGQNWGAPSAAGLPSAPASSSSPASSGGGTTFDQAAFDRAQKAAIAGQFLASSRNAVSMFDLGPKSSDVPAGLSLFGPGLLTTTMPNRADYTKTTAAAQTGLQALAGDTNLTTHPGSIPAGQGDVNPLAHGWTLGRTDQGVDASAPSGTAILAINDSVVKDVVPNWYNGQPLVLMQLTAGPNRGKYYYLAEQVHNGSGSAYSGGKDWKVGQTFARGQVIGRYAPMGTGIEIGWGSPTSAGRTLAQEQGQTGDVSHGNAPAGIAFRKQILGG